MHLTNVQIENQFLPHGNGHNKSLFGAFVVSFVALFAILFIPTLKNLFSLTRLSFIEWGIVWILSIIPTILVEITKWMKRKFNLTII